MASELDANELDDAAEGEAEETVQVPEDTTATNGEASEEAEEDEEPLTAGEEAREFLLDVLDAMQMETTDVDVEEEGDGSWKLTFTGDGTGDLVGRYGDTLNSLQYLATLVTARRSGEQVRLLLDADGYREKRRAALIEQAETLAAEVIKVGAEAELDPLNPYERRIIHQALAEHPQVITYSEGEGENRRIVIAPRPQA